MNESKHSSTSATFKRKSPRTLSIGGATYDLFVRVPHEKVHSDERSPVFSLPLGEKIRVEEVVEMCGGGASNTSVGLSRLGCDASIATVIGADQWGQTLLKNFQKEKVRTESLTIVEGEMTSFSIILNGKSGERVILYEPGTNAHMHDAVFDRNAAASVDWVILNHITENACVIQDDLVAILAQPEPRLTWNPGGCQIDAGPREKNNRQLLASTDLLILNREEVLRFTQCTDVLEAMKSLFALGVRCVCVTDGKRGAMAMDGKRLYRSGVCPGVTVVNTTGAGDAFTTGMTWAMIHGQDLPTALRAGTINSGSVVSMIGAERGLLTDIEMRERLVKTHIDVSEQPL